VKNVWACVHIRAFSWFWRDFWWEKNTRILRMYTKFIQYTCVGHIYRITKTLWKN
jgi:hypothetical protein